MADLYGGTRVFALKGRDAEAVVSNEELPLKAGLNAGPSSATRGGVGTRSRKDGKGRAGELASKSGESRSSTGRQNKAAGTKAASPEPSGGSVADEVRRINEQLVKLLQ